MAKQLQITLKRSTIGCLKKQKATIEALGLKKIGASVVQNDGACLQGMLKVVSHLVTIQEL